MANYTYYVDLRGVELSEATQGWIDLMRVGKYIHPLYGEMDFTPEKLKQFADNFATNVRGIDLSIDYDHRKDPTKGNEAAGWIKQVVFDGSVLKGLVDFTRTAYAKIKEGAYRYFSPEFQDKWTDANGVTHDNVLFGGGITNRPYLKDLLPINLSELVFNEPEPKKENDVDPKQLRASIGLAEDATDAEVETRLGLIKTLHEAFPAGPPAPPNDPTPPTPPAPPAPVFNFGGGIKELAESNPEVAALVRFVEGTVQENRDNARKLTEQNVTMKLNEFDTSQLALSPVARELVLTVMLHEDMTEPLRDKIWQLMDDMKKSNKFFVELGERGSSATHRSMPGANAQQKFEGMVRQLMETSKMGYADAASAVSRDYPQLFNEYRDEAIAFVE